jgi:MFS-type transporter involved in bile tolerance (Atg22 family)
VKVSADTVVQQQIDDVHRGRVFSIYDMSVNVGLVLGVTAVAVATGTGRIPAYVAIGVGILLACGAGLAARTPNQPG